MYYSCSIQVRYLAIGLCGLNFFLAIAPSFTGELYLPGTLPWSAGNVIKATIYRGRHTFLLQNTSKVTSLEDLEGVELSAVNVMIGILHSIIFTSRVIIMYCIETGMVLIVGSLWLAVKIFHEKTVKKYSYIEETTFEHVEMTRIIPIIERVPHHHRRRRRRRETSRNTTNPKKEEQKRRFTKIMIPYNKLKVFCDIINEVFGGVVIFFVTHWTIGSPTLLDKLFAPNVPWYFRLRIVIFLLEGLVAFLMAADACVKVIVISFP